MNQKAATMNDMLKIVCVFISRPESEPFREPVDYKGLGLLDYPKIVKKPMDLGTIKRNIENNEYVKNTNTINEAIELCAADIRLVWTNCLSYNQDGSDFYHLALTFARKFEDVYAQLKKLHNKHNEPLGAKNDEDGMEKVSNKDDVATIEDVIDYDRIPTLDERLQLSYDIFRISNIDMGVVLTYIEKHSPAGVSRKGGAADEVLINFDMLTPNCFHHVAQMIKSGLENKLNSKSKKKRSIHDISQSQTK